MSALFRTPSVDKFELDDFKAQIARLEGIGEWFARYVWSACCSVQQCE